MSFKATWCFEREKPTLLFFLPALCLCGLGLALLGEKKKKKSLKHLLTPAQMRVALQRELNFKQVRKGCPGMLSQIRAGQTSPEQRPFLLLMAGATIMVINVSPACHSTVKFYDQKKCFSPFALSGSSRTGGQQLCAWVPSPLPALSNLPGSDPVAGNAAFP